MYQMDDDQLLTAFETLTIRPEDFHHKEHVRVAFALLRRERDLAAAAVAFRALLQRFAAAAGVAAKYHETLTWAYLAVIAGRMHGHDYAGSAELLDANPDLLDHESGAIARHYDVAAVTQSPLARAVFVLPERPAGRSSR